MSVNKVLSFLFILLILALLFFIKILKKERDELNSSFQYDFDYNKFKSENVARISLYKTDQSMSFLSEDYLERKKYKINTVYKPSCDSIAKSLCNRMSMYDYVTKLPFSNQDYQVVIENSKLEKSSFIITQTFFAENDNIAFIAGRTDNDTWVIKLNKSELETLGIKWNY